MTTPTPPAEGREPVEVPTVRIELSGGGRCVEIDAAGTLGEVSARALELWQELVKAPEAPEVRFGFWPGSGGHYEIQGTQYGPDDGYARG